MPTPAKDWIDRLPRDRCIAEFSLWSARLTRLCEDLARIDPHADVLHLDVADGRFAPTYLFFPDLVTQIRKETSVPIHVHLMVEDGDLVDQAEQFAEAGADLISIHVENAAVADVAFDVLENAGVACGMVVRVETPVAELKPFLPSLDFITLLGTAIGVKGQDLDASATGRLAQATELLAGLNDGKRRVLAADGAIRDHTVPKLIAAGAQSVVLGSLAFGADDLAARMDWLAAQRA
ncbi:MAG: ribulose-phosphate 3-epimerase [Pseudomonadota bacterium]